MTRKQELSEKHAAWLEDERAIPSEIAAEKGVVSLGTSWGSPTSGTASASSARCGRRRLAGRRRSTRRVVSVELGLSTGPSTRRIVDHHGGRARRVVCSERR